MILIVEITWDHSLFIPNGSILIQLDDKFIFMGTSPAIDSLATSIYNILESGNDIQTVVLIGGGSVGFILAIQLEQSRIRVKLIKSNRDRCIFLADNLQDSLILHGDGTDLELLEEESAGDGRYSLYHRQ